MKNTIINLLKIAFVFSVITVLNSCEDQEETSFAFNNISAPSNLNALIEMTNPETNEVSVTLSGENASSFEVYFGDVENEEPTIANPGETITNEYPEAGEYILRAVARSVAGATSELSRSIIIGEGTMEVEPVEPEDPEESIETGDLEFPVDHESTSLTYEWIGFGSADFGAIPATVVSNPDASGLNTSNTVLEIQKLEGAQVWAGSSLLLSGPIDFSASATVSINVWSPRSGVPILFKIEDSSSPIVDGIPSIFAEIEMVTTVANEWEELVFDMSTFASFDASNSYNNIVIFPDFGNNGQGETFYFDDVMFANSALDALLQFPVDHESASLTYEWIGFGSADFGAIPATVVSNPDASGLNTSNTVLEIQKLDGAQVWAGSSLLLSGPIDFSASTIVSINVWSPRSGVPILFKIEDSSSPIVDGIPSIFAEIEMVTTVANEWEELVFDMSTFASFDASNSYNNIVIFPDFGNNGQGETFYFDDIMFANNSLEEVLELPVDHESTSLTYEWIGFGSADFGAIPATVVSNPDASGLNTSNTVLEIQKLDSAQVWAGSSLLLSGPIDFSTSTTISINVWSPRVGVPILFKIEDSSSPIVDGIPSIFAEIEMSTTVVNEWEELVFDMSTFASFDASNSYNNIVIFPDFGNNGQGETFYFDDVMFNE